MKIGEFQRRNSSILELTNGVIFRVSQLQFGLFEGSSVSDLRHLFRRGYQKNGSEPARGNDEVWSRAKFHLDTERVMSGVPVLARSTGGMAEVGEVVLDELARAVEAERPIFVFRRVGELQLPGEDSVSQTPSHVGVWETEPLETEAAAAPNGTFAPDFFTVLVHVAGGAGSGRQHTSSLGFVQNSLPIMLRDLEARLRSQGLRPRFLLVGSTAPVKYQGGGKTSALSALEQVQRAKIPVHSAVLVGHGTYGLLDTPHGWMGFDTDKCGGTVPRFELPEYANALAEVWQPHLGTRASHEQFVVLYACQGGNEPEGPSKSSGSALDKLRDHMVSRLRALDEKVVDVSSGTFLSSEEEQTKPVANITFYSSRANILGLCSEGGGSSSTTHDLIPARWGSSAGGVDIVRFLAPLREFKEGQLTEKQQVLLRMLTATPSDMLHLWAESQQDSDDGGDEAAFWLRAGAHTNPTVVQRLSSPA